jgi:hypothetical protein
MPATNTRPSERNFAQIGDRLVIAAVALALLAEWVLLAGLCYVENCLRGMWY